MKEITPKEVESLLKKENIHVIDVRETEEVKAGKIPDAVNIPLGLLEFRMHELDKAKEYIMVCRSGEEAIKLRSCSRTMDLRCSIWQAACWNGTAQQNKFFTNEYTGVGI